MKQLTKRLAMSFLLVLPILGVMAMNSYAVDYPDKPIIMIDPWPPGGSADLTGRLAASVASEYLKQPISMKYEAGAAGMRGAEALSRADADGYTVGLIGQGAIINQTANMQKAPFGKDDFEFIGQMTALPCLLVAKADAPFKSLNEMVAYIKAHPKEIVYSSSGRYGFVHTAIVRVLAAADAKNTMIHLPTKGGAAATTELLGGRSQVSGNPVSVLAPHIKAGTIIPLAICDTERHPDLPDVPTVSEVLGVDVTPTEFWIAPAVPKGTPPERLKYLRDKFAEISKDPSVNKMAAKMGNPIRYISGEDFQKKWDKEWKEAKELGELFTN